MQLFTDILECLQEDLMQLRKEVEVVRKLTRTPPACPSPRLLTTAELCRELNINHQTLYHYIKRFSFPVYRVGRKNYYRLSEVHDFILKAATR